MTDEIDVMKKAIMHYDNAVRLKKMYQELYDHLIDSIVWIFKYTEKDDIALPKRDELYMMIKRPELLIDEITNVPTTESQHGNKTTEDSTEPKFALTMDTIFINCVAATFLSKMPDANGEEYPVDSQQLQVNDPSAVVMLL
ncbi:MAG: hypothetical protein WAM14_01700 [Candidatus Nitrosopolaris sp.]